MAPSTEWQLEVLSYDNSHSHYNNFSTFYLISRPNKTWPKTALFCNLGMIQLWSLLRPLKTRKVCLDTYEFFLWIGRFKMIPAAGNDISFQKYIFIFNPLQYHCFSLNSASNRQIHCKNKETRVFQITLHHYVAPNFCFSSETTKIFCSKLAQIWPTIERLKSR